MNKKTAIGLSLFASLAVGGTVMAKTGIGQVTGNQTVSAAHQDKVTREQARQIALGRVPGEIVDEEFEKEHGRMVFGFEIKQADGTVLEVKIDELTGKIIYVGRDDGDGEDDDSMDADDDGDRMNAGEPDQTEASLLNQAKITRTQAEKTALKKVKGKIVAGELELENGKLVYSFDIRTKKGTVKEVQVDAKTGRIVSVEEEDDAKEAAEKDQK